MNTVNTDNFPDKGLPLRAGLWLAQVLLASVYLPTGIAALCLPAGQALTIIPWTGHMSEEMLRFIGAVDLAAGLGVLLPSLTRVAPGLAVLAGVCSAALQGLAILLHVLFGVVFMPLYINLAVLALSVFVAWGRSGKASIVSRWQGRRMPDIGFFAGEPIPESGDRRKTRRRTTRRHRRHGNKTFQNQRGMRGAPSCRAKIQRKFCDE